MADNRNDDITDLTADEDAAAGKAKQSKKKEKKENKPAQPGNGDNKAATADKKDGKKDKKKGGAAKKKGGLLKLILILIPVIIVAAFVAALILDLYDMRGIVSGFISKPVTAAIVWLDPEYSSVKKTLVQTSNTRREELEKEYQDRKTELDYRERDLESLRLELEGREAAAVDNEKQLDKRAAALDKREANIGIAESVAPPIYLRELSEQELSALQSLSRAYASMEAEAAATILAELHEPESAAVIIFHMSERKAAAILAVMDPDLAARITELLMER